MNVRKEDETKTPSKLWTIEKVANELQCSVRHITKLVTDGKIPKVKVGRSLRFHPVEISRWFRNGGTR